MRRRSAIRVPAVWPGGLPDVPDVELPLLVVDGGGRLVSWNPAARTHLAVVADDLAGVPLHELAVDENELAALFALTSNGRSERAEINLRSDVLVETISEVTIDPIMAGGRRAGAVVAIRSLPRRFSPGALTLRRYEPGDGTPPPSETSHRVALYDRLRADLAGAAAKGERLGVILIDVSALRHMQPAGDATVPLGRQLGDELTSSLRDGDAITNLGDDELVVVVGSDPGESQLDVVVARLRARIAAALQERGAPGVRIWSAVALFPGDGLTPPQLLVRAYARLAEQRLGPG